MEAMTDSGRVSRHASMAAEYSRSIGKVWAADCQVYLGFGYAALPGFSSRQWERLLGDVVGINWQPCGSGSRWKWDGFRAISMSVGGKEKGVSRGASVQIWVFGKR